MSDGHSYPDLARIWYDDPARNLLDALAAMIKRAQESGHVRLENPQVHPFSIVGPLLTGVLFREVLFPIGADIPDLPTLAEHHARIVLGELLTQTLPS